MKRSRVAEFPLTTVAASKLPDAFAAEFAVEARLREAIAARVRSDTNRDAARLDAQQQKQRADELGLQLELVCASEARLREQVLNLRASNAESHALRQRDACEARVALEQLRLTLAGETAAERTTYNAKLSRLHDETAQRERTRSEETMCLQVAAGAGAGAVTRACSNDLTVGPNMIKAEDMRLRAELEAAKRRLTDAVELEQLNVSMSIDLDRANAEASRAKTITLEVERLQVEVCVVLLSFRRAQLSARSPTQADSHCVVHSSDHYPPHYSPATLCHSLPPPATQGARGSHCGGKCRAITKAASRGRGVNGGALRTTFVFRSAWRSALAMGTYDRRLDSDWRELHSSRGGSGRRACTKINHGCH